MISLASRAVFARILTACLLTVFLAFGARAASVADPASEAQADRVIALSDLKNTPLTFAPNYGQWDERVGFRSDVGGASIWYTRDAVYFQLSRRTSPHETPAEPMPPSQRDKLSHADGSRLEFLTYALRFEGAGLSSDVIGESPTGGRLNYLIGNDPARWHTDIPIYQSIVYRNVYPGISLRYRGNPDQLEYDFELAPGADPARISLTLEGIRQVSKNAAGQLVLATDWGNLIEQAPRVYQRNGSQEITIGGEYTVTGPASFGFKLGKDYDPSLPATIDPVLTYSTYLGGAANDYGEGIVVDSAGSAYIVGYTSSGNFPVVGAYDGSQNGNNDAFVTRLSDNGRSVIYSTFIGGANDDRGAGIVLFPSGEVALAGYTASTDFPTLSAYDATANGGLDAFVVRLNAAGNGLIYSTYLGGSADDRALAITVDTIGRVYIGGETVSTDFPIPAGYDGSANGAYDGFVARLSVGGATLDYASYLGGTLNDGVYGVAVDNNNVAYVTGYTNSTNFPAVAAYDPTHNFGYDVFVAKFSSTGSTLDYSTYLGGTGTEWANAIALDASKNICITGLTTSNLFPVSNAFDASFNSLYDAFVTKIASSGTSLVYSTFLGGQSADEGLSVAVDKLDQAVVTGYTYSSNFPTQNPVTPLWSGGQDIFVTKLTQPGNQVVYSTYIGGSDDEKGHAVALDRFGNACITGITLSPGFPLASAYDSSANGGYDAFVLKLSDAADLPHILLSPSSLSFDAAKDEALPLSKTFTLSNSKPNTQVLKWYASDNQPWMTLSHDSGQTNLKTITVTINTTSMTPGVYTGTITVSSPNAENSPQTILVSYEVWTPIMPVILVHGLASDTTVWSAMKASLAADGASQVWSAPLDACGSPSESLFTTSPKYLYQGNASELAAFITAKYSALPANIKTRVRGYDFVAHGMGGLVVRRYLSPTATDSWSPVSTRNVVMLGTPNDGLGLIGDKTKLYGCSGPATREQHTRRMLLFNSFYTDATGVSYFGVWGTGGCSPGGVIQPGCGGWRKLAGRFLECANDDLVPATSVAGQKNGGIDRYNKTFGVSACYSQLPGDASVYTNYVKPILQSTPPASFGDVAPVQPQIGYQFDSTLAAGAVKSGSFAVESNTSMTIFLFASDSKVRFKITSPGSVVYDSTSTLPDSSRIWVTDSLGIRGFYVSTAAAGTWQWTVDAGSASAAVNFSLVEAIENSVKVNKWQNLVYPVGTDTLRLMVIAKANSTRITGLTVIATPIFNDSTFGAPFNLLDNGTSGDSANADGVYGKLIPNPDSGLLRYNIRVTGTGPSGPISRYLSVAAYSSGTACLCANIDGSYDGSVDIGDLSRLIDYLYVSLTPLGCARAANVDGSSDGRVDISDLTYLIGYLFLGGPPPACL
jgi:pimeloyl-ACP methyl ester carboxylesterase